MQLAPCCCLSLLSFLTVLLLTCRCMTMFSFNLCKEIKGHSKCFFFYVATQKRVVNQFFLIFEYWMLMSKLCRIVSCYKKGHFFVLRVVTLFLELLSRLFIVCSLSDLLQQQLELFFWCSLWAFLLALQLTLFLPQKPTNTITAFFASILPLFESPSRASTPSFSFPSSLSSPLFSWSLHSTPPLQTGHKRAESATPDL